ncbi:MAG: TonB-dependent receptor [Tannerellaceae bacterium]|nr:TonB-dependent receptor [Tannerellaceae bacterium]
MNFGGNAAGQVTNEGTSSRATQVGFVYRLGYTYDGKYMAEVSGRYDGNYYFAPGSKWAFFPSFSLAWNMAEEEIIKKNAPYLNQLKVRGSYGESGNLAGSAYQYLTGYEIYSGSTYFGDATTGIRERKQGNPEITWERAKKFNVGFDALLWNGLLALTADYFYENRDNMLVEPKTEVPLEYGIGLSQVNGGKMSNQGVELALGSNFNIHKDWNIDLRGTMTFAKIN